MRTRRLLLLLLGALLAVTGFGFLVGGAGLGWAMATQRDDAGFFTTGTHGFESSTYAITTEAVDLGRPGDEWWADRNLATVRLAVTATRPTPLFVGIGPSADVQAYLAGVPHDEVTDVRDSPFRATYTTREATGTSTLAPPTERGFWVATAAGQGPQTLTWDVRPGTWTLVVMNSDATRPVAADVQFGGRVSYLGQVTAGLLAAAVVLLVMASVLLVRGAAGPARTHVPVPTHAGYPLRLEGRLDPEVSRWMWLVKWFLAIPHYLVLAVLWVAFAVLTVVAFVSIAVTGRYPRRIFDVNVGVLRWTWRVAFYATSVLGTDRYPPFTLATADYPATLDVAYPERLSRGLVWVKSWLLALPHLVIVGLLVGNWGGRDGAHGVGFGGGLLGVLTLVAGVLLLVRGRYHRGVFDLLMGANRWQYRVIAYVALMTDEYPPFRLDQGGAEPPVPGDPLPPPAPPAASGATPGPDRELVPH